MAEDEIHDVHDRGYRLLLSCLKLFQELVEGFVDGDWTGQLRLDLAERVDKSFVLESFREKESDILYRVPLGDTDIYVYVLIELQSTVDFLMAFRLLIYIVEVWKYVFENTPEDVRSRRDYRLPPVYPIVLYNGERKWTASVELRNLIAGSDLIPTRVPNFEYLLVDVSHYSRERLRELRNGLAAGRGVRLRLARAAWGGA